MVDPTFGDTLLPKAFWDKILVNDETGCWEWQAGRDRDDYGAWYHREHNTHGRRTHRIAYVALVEAFPAELQIDHLCGTRRCCNPAHLEPVTLRENVDRSSNYIGKNRAKTHCPQGHAYEGDNLVIVQKKNGPARICRTCRNTQALAAFYRTKWNPAGRGAQADRTHCAQGHVYDEANTRINISKLGKTSRACRTCDRDAKRTAKLRRADSLAVAS